MNSPLSHSHIFLACSSPRTPEQWTRELQRVKILYLQQKYKQCAARVEEIFMASREPIHAIHQTYLYFYSAISYEVLGRAAHNYSSNKLALLHSALDCFTICSAVLPSTIPDLDHATVLDKDMSDESFSSSLVDHSCDVSFESGDSSVDGSQSPESVGGLVNSLTRIIDDSMAWGEEDPFISHGEVVEMDGFSVKLPREDSSKTLLMPSPLRLHKSDEFGGIMSTIERRPPPPAANNQEHNKYNNSIRFLRTQLTTSIATIHALIDEVTQLQRARKATRTLRRAASFWSFSPIQSSPGQEDESADGDGGQKMESKEERIARLRANGWRTVGMRNERRGWKGSEYYRGYCNMVLDEMYCC